ncbi:MAG: hypothetical protein P1U63_13075 [Coxiellaceae bacterium]|nr:hypothetical protein [Coxiellaceae bacterium]
MRPFTLKRCIRLNQKDGIRKQNKKGISFFGKPEESEREVVDLYTKKMSECPAARPGLPVGKNHMKIFSTGDLFSTVSPSARMRGKDVHVHVDAGLDENTLLLSIHEALQLCRTAYEHGAKTVVVSLPEMFHPILQPEDFHFLLLKLFKAAGAHEAYFKRPDHVGGLAKDYRSETDDSALNKKKISEMLFGAPASADDSIQNFLRRQKFTKAWLKINPEKVDIVTELSEVMLADHLDIDERSESPHVIFYGAADQSKAEAIHDKLLALGEDVLISPYEGKGIHAKLPQGILLHASQVTILHTTRPDPDDIEACKLYAQCGATPYLFEVLSLANQSRLRGAKTINFVNPYQFGSRSDKAEDNQKGIVGAFVQLNARLLEAAGINHIVTAECHDSHTLSGSYTTSKIRSTAIPAMSNITMKVAQAWLKSIGADSAIKLRLIAPDAGAEKRTKLLNQHLQLALGERYCHARIVGEKQRSSHSDSSAVIEGMSASSVSISDKDVYLLTDDETATGTTLCQAIAGVKARGVENVVVILAHNNLPLDTLTRHLCLARFIVMGASELHFSDSQLMGTLSPSYVALVERVVTETSLSAEAVEAQIEEWIQSHVPDADKAILLSFKSVLNGGLGAVNIHSLSEDFADVLAATPEYSHVYSGAAFECK